MSERVAIRQMTWCGLLAFVLGAPALAAGKDTKVLVYPVVPMPGEVSLSQAKEVSAAIFDELGRIDGIEVERGKDASWAGSARNRSDPESPSLRAIVADLEQGKRLSEKMRFPQAIKALRAGLEAADRSPEALNDYDVIVDSHLLLAEAYYRRGKDRLGASVLDDLGRIRPWLKLDETKYPPLFVNVWEDARERALARTRGSALIEASGAPADVVVNGKTLGKTPLKVTQLIPGRHHIVVRGEAGTWGRSVEVSEAQEAKIEAQLKAVAPASRGLGDELAGNSFSPGLARNLRKEGRSARADQVLVFAMGGGDRVFEVAGFLGDVESGKWTRVELALLDTELLSVSLEANKIAKNVAEAVASNPGDVTATVAVFERSASSPIAVGAPGSVQSVSYLPAELVREPAVAVASSQKSGKSGSSSSLDPRKGPITSDSGLEGGISATSLDGPDPLSPTRIDEDTTSKDNSILDEWWLWTAVGVVAVAAVGGTYLLFFHDPQVDSVAVEAVW